MYLPHTKWAEWTEQPNNTNTVDTEYAEPQQSEQCRHDQGCTLVVVDGRSSNKYSNKYE